MIDTKLVERASVKLAIEKRDGRSQKYDPLKIRNALIQAVQKSSLPYSKEAIEQITSEVDDIIKQNKPASIDTSLIDEYVLQRLHSHQMNDLAESYVQRRIEKENIRKNSRDINQKIDQLLDKDPKVVNENANKDSNVFNTQRDLTAGSVGKTIGLRILPPHVANAHEKGEIHYHDLDYTPYAPMTNCCLIDFKTMFEEGVEIGNAEVESPRSIQTAAAQTAQIIANVASSQYGGCSFDRVDEF